MLCYVMLCYVMLCYVMLYYIVLYHILIYYIILYYTNSNVIRVDQVTFVNLYLFRQAVPWWLKMVLVGLHDY